MKPVIVTDHPPYRVTSSGSVEIRCPKCDRFHVEHMPVTPGDWFRWSCKKCGQVSVTLPDDLPMIKAA